MISKKIKETMATLKSQINNLHSDHLTKPLQIKLIEEINLITKDVSLYSTELQDFLLLTSVPKSKDKRGLFNAIGTFQKYLFGLADDDDRQTIYSKLSMLDKTNDQLLNNNEAQIQIITSLDHRISNNTKVINEIIRKAQTITNALIASNITEQNKQFEKIYKFLNAQSTLQEILLLLGEIKSSLQTFSQSLQQSYTNHLSYNLIGPNILLKNLLNIKKKAPKHLELPLPLRSDTIYSFYPIIKVHTLLQDQKLIIILDIPMLNEGNQIYKILKIFPIPIYHPHIKRWLTFKLPENTLAINFDSRLYFTLPDNALESECDNSNICTFKSVIINTFQHQTCPLSIIRNETNNINSLCHREIFNTPNNIIVTKLNKAAWLYSTKEPVKYNLTCLTNSSVNSSTFNATGTFTLNPGCYIETNDFLLQSPEIGSNTNNLTLIQHISISNIISNEENFTLTEDPNITSSLFNDMIITDKSNEIQLTALLQQIRNAKREKQLLKISTYGGSIVIILIIILISLCLLCKFRSRQIVQRELAVMLNVPSHSQQNTTQN